MFLGGGISGAAVGCAFLDFSRHRRFFGKIEMHTSLQDFPIFMALIAVSYNLGIS